MKTDIEIAQKAHLRPIAEVAESVSIPAQKVETLPLTFIFG